MDVDVEEGDLVEGDELAEGGELVKEDKPVEEDEPVEKDEFVEEDEPGEDKPVEENEPGEEDESVKEDESVEEDGPAEKDDAGELVEEAEVDELTTFGDCGGVETLLSLCDKESPPTTHPPVAAPNTTRITIKTIQKVRGKRPQIRDGADFGVCFSVSVGDDVAVRG